MKSAGQIMLVAALLAGGRAWAGDLALTGNPYATVVERNIFGLVPIPTVDPAAQAPPADPPPKITPNGIMNLFGKLQVLFKVPAKPKAGQPPKEESYVLSEGERQDDIEVLKIDEAGSLVTFNNHGTRQELPLANAPNISTPAAPAPGGVVPGGVAGSAVPSPALPRPGFNGSRFGRPPNVPSGGESGGNPQASGSPGFGAPNFNGGTGGQPQERLSPEAQVIMIEAQREQWKAAGNPAAAILPPTPLTQGGPPMPGGE
jgi:hypothetical protein